MAAIHRFEYRERIQCERIPDSAEEIGSTVRAAFPELDILWGSGTAVSTFDKFWFDLGRSLADGATEDLDLTALTWTAPSPYATVNFAEVRAIFIRTRSTNTTTLQFKGSVVTNPWIGLGTAWLLDLQKNANLRLINPTDGAWPTSGTNKNIRVINSAGAAGLYDILILGTSA